MKIGNIEISGYAALAPMAGVADKAMRQLCREYGAAYTVGELTSAKGVSMGDKKSASYLSVGDAERPMASQLFGADPDIMAQAAKQALSFNPDFIDINMGCPAPKVAAGGGGSALLKNPRLAGEIVAAVKSAVNIPVTAKIRIGWDDNSINATEMAKILEDSGADAITVHGRTRAQMYSPGVRRDIIREVKNAVQIPVIANGDVTDAKSAKQMYDETDCDFIMVGRAAMGNPFVFEQINHYMETGEILPEPSLQKRLELMIKHIELMHAYKDPYIAILESRKHTAWYMRGLKNAAAYRKMCAQIKSLDDIKRIYEKVLAENADVC